MNYRMIIYIIGKILKVIGACLFLPLIVCFIYRDCSIWGYLGFIIPAVSSIGIGELMSFRKPKNNSFFAREGLVIVGISWIVISLVGCLPFLISREIPSFIDAFFETVSGLTTTGGSILTDVEALSHGMLFWRSFTHWIGGMGVLVFVLSFLPSSAQNIHLLKAESPGPTVGKLVSKVKLTATILYCIYGALTFIEMVFLLCGGMPLFDSIVNSFATAGTGGFAIKNAGIGYYSTYCQIIITIFMILFGVNFNLYYLILIGHFKQAIKSEELRWYLGIIFASALIITANLTLAKNASYNLGFATNLKNAFFQVGSIITTTGFSTVDFNEWPVLSHTILFTLMFVGACAGSTGGGMKVSRIVILFKAIGQNMKKMIHPHSVSTVRFEGQKVDKDVVSNVVTYVSLIFVIYFVSILIVSIDEYDFTSNLTAVAACINNIGPGLNLVGPMGNFAHFSVLSKSVLIFDMLVGRLEIFPVLILFNPKTWKK